MKALHASAAGSVHRLMAMLAAGFCAVCAKDFEVERITSIPLRNEIEEAGGMGMVTFVLNPGHDVDQLAREPATLSQISFEVQRPVE